MNPTQSQTDGRVYLHDLLHALQTGIGTRPRPAGGKDAAEMVPVPVELQLTALTGTRDDGAAGVMTLDVTRFELFRRNGSPPRLVLFVEVPDTHRLADLAAYEVVPIAEEVLAPDPDAVQIGGDEPDALPPELRHLDPAVFTVNTDKPAGYSGKRDSVPNSGDQGG